MATRSPKNPGITFSEALERARQVYSVEHRNPMNSEIIAEHMGYRGITGTSLRAISSLRQYGFIEGRGEESRISEDAITIFADEEARSVEWAEAMQRGVEKPPLFQTIRDAFPSVPSQANLRGFLEKRGFTRKAADKAAVIYRDSTQFVDQETADIIGMDNRDATDFEDNVAQLPSAKLSFNSPTAPQVPKPEMGHLVEITNLKVSKNTAIRLLADGPYDKTHIEGIIKQLELQLSLGAYDDPVSFDSQDDDPD